MDTTGIYLAVNRESEMTQPAFIDAFNKVLAKIRAMYGEKYIFIEEHPEMLSDKPVHLNIFDEWEAALTYGVLAIARPENEEYGGNFALFAQSAYHTVYSRLAKGKRIIRRDHRV